MGGSSNTVRNRHSRIKGLAEGVLGTKVYNAAEIASLIKAYFRRDILPANVNGYLNTSGRRINLIAQGIGGDTKGLGMALYTAESALGYINHLIQDGTLSPLTSEKCASLETLLGLDKVQDLEEEDDEGYGGGRKMKFRSK